MDLKACDEAYVLRCEIAHEHTAYRPIDNIDATDIPAAYGKVVSLIMAGCIEPWQVVGVMAEVGIHLEDIVVAVLQGPLEALYVGGTQTKLA